MLDSRANSIVIYASCNPNVTQTTNLRQAMMAAWKMITFTVTIQGKKLYV